MNSHEALAIHERWRERDESYNKDLLCPEEEEAVKEGWRKLIPSCHGRIGHLSTKVVIPGPI